MRKLLPTVGVIAILVVCSFLGLDLKKLRPTLQPKQSATPAASAQPPTIQPIPAAQVIGGDTVRVATFNIQVFGTTKLQNAAAMKVLVSVIRRFDVVAIQEVRSTDDTVVPRFVGLINADGSRFDYVIGPRLGRTNSKEQYAVVFNTARIEVDRGSIYTADDPRDLLHREPLVARFRARGVPPQQAFTFTLVDIHTDPDETGQELDALADVFTSVQRNGSGEDDVIVLGDLNVDERHLGRLGQIPGVVPVVHGTTTNTRHNAAYDNLVLDRRATVEFTGRWGVVDLATEFGLSTDEALKVSDHCPVWAEFSAYEGGSTIMAATPSAPSR